MKIELIEIARPAKVDSISRDRASATVTYHKGDPEFDIYVQENLAYRERLKLMVEEENGLPKNFFAIGSEGTTSSGIHLGDKITKSFELFYRGYINEKDIETTISDVIVDLRKSYVEKGYDENEFMPKLIEDAYSIARLSSVSGAGIASWYEGRDLEVQYNNGKGHSKDWIYYNADYYYRSEEMKETLVEITKRIAGKYKIDVELLDLPTEYPEGDLRRNIYTSYNTYINERIRNDYRIGNMINETMPPPKGLRFFYKGNESGTSSLVPRLPAPFDEPEAAFDSVLSVWYGDWTFVGRVPVRQNSYQFPGYINMFDAISSGKNHQVPSKVIGFLSNFDFFTANQSGSYIKAHPRQS